MAERSDVEFEMDDPLNLMRVMPTQGGQPCFSAHGFIFLTTNRHEDESEPRITRITRMV